MRNKIITLLLVISAVAHAQTDRTEALILSENNGWEYEVKAGINIGGASPIPLPVEIRKVESYSPKFNGTIEGVVTKWLGTEKKWGISAGLKFEEKGMITGAQVKAYGMEIISEGSRVSGLWTGHVKTNYNSTMLTIPVMANYKLGRLWKVRAGLFASLKLDGDFTGSVSDGYLREKTPVGQKIAFTNGNSATYDFGSHLCHMQWGAQMGGTWRAFNHFTVNADLSWGFNDIFESNFKTISFKLIPIYLNLGFGYRF